MNDSSGSPLAAPLTLSAPTFASLGLSAALAQACAQAGFTTPSPIQVEAIPPLLRGQDLLGLAPTGSGKTAAYALPLLQRLLAGGGPEGFRRVRVLVLVPTRELAAQVGDVFLRLGSSSARPLKIAVVHGGVSVNPQMMRLRGGADIVVATPGRLLDLVDRNAVRLDAVAGAGARRGRSPAGPGLCRRTASACWPRCRRSARTCCSRRRSRRTCKPWRTPCCTTRCASTAASQVDGHPGRSHRGRSRSTLPAARSCCANSCCRARWRRVLVFVATRYATEHVAHKLASRGVQAAPFHGEMSQAQRTRVLQDFAKARVNVLVTTDLAARGIDVPGLSVVVNYDLPRSPDDYVHRIGRTARAGASGVAVSFVSAATETHMRLIEKRQDVRLAREQVAGFEPARGGAARGGRPPAPAASRASGRARRTSCAPRRRSRRATGRRAAAGSASQHIPTGLLPAQERQSAAGSTGRIHRVPHPPRRVGPHVAGRWPAASGAVAFGGRLVSAGARAAGRRPDAGRRRLPSRLRRNRAAMAWRLPERATAPAGAGPQARPPCAQGSRRTSIARRNLLSAPTGAGAPCPGAGHGGGRSRGRPRHPSSPGPRPAGGDRRSVGTTGRPALRRGAA